MIENGTLLQDRYLIERQIGAGGMGAVYLAVDQRFGSHVAIKETFYKNDELGEAFEREAHLLNSLLHPVLPHVSDFFTENNGHFLVMQFIEGEDLFEVLKREGAFPVRDVLRWTDSLLDALDYLHSQEPPIIHRDIKPQNLKITPRGDVILLDFGLAKLSSEDTTGVKSIFGYSRKYSPLEQIQGTGTDARSDLFALAATAYHLLTGKPPIDVLNRAAEIIVGNPDPLPLASEINNEIPVDVANVLNSAMALNASRRFASAKAMRQALEHAVNLYSAENVEEVPEQAPAVVPTGVGAINSVETEDFPALEAFAVDSAVALPETDDTERLEAVEIPPLDAQMPLPATKAATQTTYLGDVTTRVSPRTNRSSFPLAALVALLICVGVTAGYFINRASLSNEEAQTPVVESVSESNSNAEQSAIVLDSPLPEAANPPLLEAVSEAKAKPVVIEKTVEKKKSSDEQAVQAETTEKPKPAPDQNEITRSARVQTPRPTQSQRSGETRTRVIEPQRAPDIESIFTGRTSAQRDEIQQRREERRRQREQMTDEELREFRRLRKQERRQRQNSQPFPF